MRIGLIDWVVPEERLDQTTESIVSGALQGSAAARGLSKKLVTASFESGFDEAFAAYLEYQQSSLLSDEHKQAMAEYRTRKRPYRSA